MKIVRGFVLAFLVFSSTLTVGFMYQGGIPAVQAPTSIIFQGDLILTGNNVTVIQGSFNINGSIIVENNATLILRNATINLIQTSERQYSINFQNPANGNPRLIVENATIASAHSFFINSYGNSSCVANRLYVWPAYQTGINWFLSDSAQMSMTNSTVYAIVVYGGHFEAFSSSMRYLQVFGSASANVSSSYVEDLTSFSSGSVIVSNSTTFSIYTRYESLIQLVNSTYSGSLTIYNSSRITVSWYLTVKVTDLYGVPLDFVNVTASYAYPNLTVVGSKLTDSNGLARFILMEKMINATGSYTVGNYFVDATHVSGAGAAQAVSITGNQEITLSLSINAQDFIVINPDGSITPSSANITTSDRTMYTFTSDNHAAIIVDRNNIIIDGMGYTVQAQGYNGFSLMGMRNVTILNTLIANSGSGVAISSSTDCIVSGNNIMNNGNGILLVASSNCAVSNNKITNNGRGLRLEYSSGNFISGNMMANNTFGNFGILGYELSQFVNYIDSSNLANGKPVYYLMNQSNIVVSPQTYPGGVGYLSLINCKNVTVRDMTLTQNAQGLLLANTNDSRIIHNNFAENGEGVDIYFSSGIVLSNNNITKCIEEGSGVFLLYSFNCTLSGNNITYSYAGSGILIALSNCTLSGNNIANNYYDGVLLSTSSGCTVSGNNIINNGYGISIYSSFDNVFYHNNFINNTVQVYSDGSQNTWDNGYPSGGNYWDTYTGADLLSGTQQNVTGSDGIGDTKYNIDVTGDTDRYPLKAPIKFFNAGTWDNTSYDVGIVSNSTITDFKFNATAKTLSFNVTGTNGTMGFCRVAIPLGLMWVNIPSEWILTVNGTSLTPSYLNQIDGYTYLYFIYAHSTETVKIQSSGAIPEFGLLTSLLFLMVITLFSTLVLKMRPKERIP